MIQPAIAVPAHNRPASLQRLLQSLAAADYSNAPAVPLIIAIDPGGENEAAVTEVAERFTWQHGQKKIVIHPQNRGLTGNVFYCGRLATEFGAIILLEDDLFVAPAFYQYALQALPHYAADERIAGISLNNLWFNGYTHHPFEPLLDGGDTYFLQVSWYQGQVYSAEMWSRFDSWLDEKRTSTQQPLHELFTAFPKTDWFPTKMRYLADSGRFYVFPRASHSTNFGETGTHFANTTSRFQVAMQHRNVTYRLETRDNALAVYDTFHELLPSRLNLLTPQLASYDYNIDLNGTKSAANLRAPFTLTTRPMHNPIEQWALAMRPPHANIVHNVLGRGISFGRTEDVIFTPRADAQLQAKMQRYHERRPISPRRRLLSWWHNRKQ